MAEVTSAATTKPARPEYLKIPTPSPNGKDTAPLGVHAVEETTPAAPLPRADQSDDIVRIAAMVLRAATERIAYHEAHARRLREVCASFASIARLNVASDPTPTGDAALAELLRMARTIAPQTGDEL